MLISEIPKINATLNFLSLSCLVLGFIAIKYKKQIIHRNFMITALSFSTLFLGFYLYYHYHVGSKKFPDLGNIRLLYLSILISHTILAVVIVPMVSMTFYYAWSKKFVQHKKWAKRTFPLWSYVSFTGILIYFFLYRWFKQ
jgi:putative membrane protein